MWQVAGLSLAPSFARFSIVALVLCTSGVLFVSGPAFAQSQVQLPTIPEPVAVSVDSRTTALLSLDFVESICPRFERCMEGVPSAASFLAQARDHNVLIVHTGATAQLPAVAPIGGETPDEANRNRFSAAGSGTQSHSEELIIPGNGPDKFVETNLESALRRRGIDTLIIQGFAANRAVMYTAMDATMRGYTVVVPVDGAPGIAAGFDELVAHYQLLTQTGRTNANNSPLAPEAVTLSRSDLITFR